MFRREREIIQKCEFALSSAHNDKSYFVSTFKSAHSLDSKGDKQVLEHIKPVWQKKIHLTLFHHDMPSDLLEKQLCMVGIWLFIYCFLGGEHSVKK